MQRQATPNLQIIHPTWLTPARNSRRFIPFFDYSAVATTLPSIFIEIHPLSKVILASFFLSSNWRIEANRWLETILPPSLPSFYSIQSVIQSLSFAPAQLGDTVF